MVKRLIRWLFSEEVDAVLFEVRELLNSAKLSTKKQYVKYDRMDLDGSRFLCGIQTVIDHEAFVMWLNSHKENCLSLMQQSMAARDERAVMLGMAQIMMIESLFKDCESFRDKYNAMLNSKKQVKDE